MPVNLNPSRIVSQNNNGLSKKIVELVTQKKYDAALVLLNNEAHLDTHHLRNYIETTRQGAHAIELIESLNIGNAVSIIQGLEKGYTKDGILKEAQEEQHLRYLLHCNVNFYFWILLCIEIALIYFKIAYLKTL